MAHVLCQSTGGQQPSSGQVRNTATDSNEWSLQAEEESAQVLGQRSKALSKRARKKAARQQAAASAQGAQAAGGATAAATSDSAAQGQAAASCSSAPTLVQTDAAAAPPAAALVSSGSPGRGDLPDQQPAATGAMPAGHAAVVARSDWWRCPLSGKVMRDPVLYGSEGHSFEQETLERWAVSNPGVDPLTGQPL